MIRKINEDRRSDIIAARDAWEAEYDKQQSALDDQKRNYNRVLNDVAQKLKQEVERAIGSTFIDLQIEVRPYGNYNTDSYHVYVRGNDSDHFAKNIALSWDWNVYLGSDGTIQKDSGSWSGLKATTAEQLSDLEETLRILKVINGLDWSNILAKANSNRPNWNDYVTLPSPSRRERPNFEKQLKQATVADIMGQDILVKGHGDGKNYNPSYDVWYYIVGETGKQYKVFGFSNNTVNIHEAQGDLAEFIHNYATYTPDRIMKDRFLDDILYNPNSDKFATKEF